MPARLSQVTVTTSDFVASAAFYDAALGALGMSRVVEFGDEEEGDAVAEVAAWAAADEPAMFWLVAGPQSTRELHAEFAAEDRMAVDRFHESAVAAGGTSRAAPRRWVIYRRGRYGAIVCDPDGNAVEVTAAE